MSPWGKNIKISKLSKKIKIIKIIKKLYAKQLGHL